MCSSAKKAHIIFSTCLDMLSATANQGLKVIFASGKIIEYERNALHTHAKHVVKAVKNKAFTVI